MSVLSGTSTTLSPLCCQTNIFQLVVASFSASSYAILLYPRDGLQFLSTSVGGESKPLEAGFNQGQQIGWFGYITEGEYYSTTTEEESSIAALAEYVAHLVRLLDHHILCPFTRVLVRDPAPPS